MTLHLCACLGPAPGEVLCFCQKSGRLPPEKQTTLGPDGAAIMRAIFEGNPMQDNIKWSAADAAALEQAPVHSANAIKVLKALEWNEIRHEYRESEYVCPVCDRDKRNGHEAGCALAEALLEPAPVQEPVTWNQVQVCTWIGNQLMTQPSMFERNAVCKFVRSLGRNEKLAKYFPAPQAQPRKADGCNWPVCQTEQYQQALADQAAQDLIGAQPRKAVKLTDDELYEMYSESAHQPAPVQEPDYKQAFDVWQDKTEWVQETAKPHELGMHRADVLRQRIEAAQPQKPALTADQIEQHIGYRLPPSSMRLLLELIGGHSA